MSLNVILPQNKLAHCGTPDRSGMSGFVFTAVLVGFAILIAAPAALLLRRSVIGVAVMGLSFAGIFGWALPHFAS